MAVTTFDFKSAGKVLKSAKQKYASIIHKGAIDKTDVLICGGLAASAFGPRGFFLALCGTAFIKLQNAWQQADPVELYKSLTISYCSLALIGCAPGLIYCPAFFETYALADTIKAQVRRKGTPRQVCDAYTTGIPFPYSRINGFRIPANADGWKWGGEMRTLCVTVSYVKGEFIYMTDTFSADRPKASSSKLDLKHPSF